ncbi:MAG: hypothetical protein HKO59_02715 [Phycisphaerales bacterium]|nr:hypothetical protein [Phycisphaerales bacterium]NNM24893.1 hypothetical protein [Phycisphaerales bacterium]
MKRSALTSVVACGALATAAFAGGGAGEFSEDFDSYVLGADIVGQGTWEHWDGLPSSPSAVVSDVVAHSAPHSLLIMGGGAPDDVVHQYEYTSGIWDLTAWQYVPGDASGGQNGFIMLNDYDHGCASCNWSIQLVVNPDAGTMESQFTGAPVPYTIGQWNEIRVRINLDLDNVDVFLNGDLIDSRAWTDGSFAGNPGILEFNCLDLFGWDGAWPTYYDDITITEVPPIGGCCMGDGVCMADQSIDDCDAAGGVFQGFGTICATVTCYAFDDTEGVWVLPASVVRDDAASSAGFSWGGAFPTTTCGLESLCELSTSPDIAFRLEVAEDAEHVISVCTADYDTVLNIGTTPCSFDIAQEDDSAGCGTASEWRGTLAAGTYYITVEGFGGGSCGQFNLSIRELCPELPAPGGKTTLEAEACGDDENGGCNMAVPAFEAIDCGVIMRGTAWHDTATRDTDWYELILTETTDITMTGTSERASTVFGLVNTGGSANCMDATAITPFALRGPCSEDGPAVVEASLEPGTWWFFVAQEFAAPFAIDCGDLDAYEFSLVCGDACAPAPDGDLTGDGFTDFSDLLEVLANFGGGGPAGDTDCNGAVEFTDLLTVIANWNPAP